MIPWPFFWKKQISGESGSMPGSIPTGLTMGSAAAPQNTNASLPEGSPVKDRPDLTMGAGDGAAFI